jgi:hypothetical protein
MGSHPFPLLSTLKTFLKTDEKINQTNGVIHAINLSTKPSFLKNCYQTFLVGRSVGQSHRFIRFPLVFGRKALKIAVQKGQIQGFPFAQTALLDLSRPVVVIPHGAEYGGIG